MKEKYQVPSAYVVWFRAEDILTVSAGQADDGKPEETTEDSYTEDGGDESIGDIG